MRSFAQLKILFEMQNYKEIDIRELRRHFPAALVCDDLSDDLFIAELQYNTEMNILKYPCRFNGYLAFFCLQGHFDVEMNLRKFQVQEGSLFIYTPGNIVRVSGTTKKDIQDVKFVIIAVSNNLMLQTHYDFNKLYDESLRLLEKPCVIIDGQEREICKKYVDLIKEISSSSVPNTKEAIASLISSTFYMMGALWADRLSVARKQNENRSVRSKAVLEDFLTLVRDNHNKERNLSFYAEKLYLTPKYLSKLVKSVSGKSAHEWIDSFVISEAMNMLKYSDMSIKSIVWELNFPNQTTFYRFFKANTGMTPSEYRKS